MVVCMFRTLGWFNLWMDGWYIESKLVLLSYSVFGYQVVVCVYLFTTSCLCTSGDNRSQYWLVCCFPDSLFGGCCIINRF